MPRTLAEQLAERPVNPDRLAAHRERMEQEIRQFHLRELRKRADLTQTELAGLLHVSQNRVSAMEQGRLDHVQIDTLRRYIEALGGHLRLVVTGLEGDAPLDLLTEATATDAARQRNGALVGANR
jgi:DNA-binding XRE family transcriptional regulator